MATSKQRTIAFLHPDLGIGGAERLVIDAAVGLQNLGHKVTIFTSHCDPKHCFDEARDGTLDVRVRGNTIVPPSILGRFAILCAILRQLHLILQITLNSELSKLQPNAFFVDQLSAGIPLLSTLSRGIPLIFYCHFPDKLLAKRGGSLKNLYRVPFDLLESWSTGFSDTVVVNSNFTKGIFGQAFPALKHKNPRVVYPCVDTSASREKDEESEQPLWGSKKVLLSINRFERKKDVGLAIRAYAKLSKEERNNGRLVIAGGYDSRVAENVSYHQELCALADSLGLQHATHKTTITALAIPSEIDVLFLLSVPNAFKSTLLAKSKLLIYTPLHEHFGIVPLEAMLAETPVLAANEGGPTETVVDHQTGWLRDVTKIDEWSSVMKFAVNPQSQGQLDEMGRRGRQRVIQEFSKDKMAARLDSEIQTMIAQSRGSGIPLAGTDLAAFGILGAVISIVVLFSVVSLATQK